MAILKHNEVLTSKVGQKWRRVKSQHLCQKTAIQLLMWNEGLLDYLEQDSTLFSDKLLPHNSEIPEETLYNSKANFIIFLDYFPLLSLHQFSPSLLWIIEYWRENHCYMLNLWAHLRQWKYLAQNVDRHLNSQDGKHVNSTGAVEEISNCNFWTTFLIWKMYYAT